MKKRILSLSLVFAMLLAMAPAVAAADPVTIIVKANDHVLITETGYKQFTHNTADSQKPETPYVGPYVITTEDPDTAVPCHIYIFAAEVGQSNNAAVTLRNVNLTGIDEDASTPLAIAGGTGAGNQTTATIKLEGDNKLKGWSGGAGLTVERNSSYAPEAIIEGPGSLTAIGGDNAAGIGCGAGKAGMGTITINSGTVHAIGGTGAAGIGRGNRLAEGWATSTYSSTININGGTVYAQGTADETNPGDASTPYGAAGIGLGYCEAGFASEYIIDSININRHPRDWRDNNYKCNECSR